MNILKKLLLTIVLLSLSVPTSAAQAQDKKTVITTFYPVYYLTSRIAGDAINVEMLLEGGQDAHSYESTAKDAVAVQASDLFIYQDDEMEFFVSDLLSIVDLEETNILESTHDLELHAGEDDHDDHDDHEEHEEEGHSHEYDPHTWLDPIFYAGQAGNIREALIELDPENEAVYQDNANQLIEELNVLNEEFVSGLADLEDRTIVVQHEAFGYLANAYDLEQLAITGLANNAEPSAKVLAEITDFVKANNVQVIYVDPTTSTSVSETVSKATGAELRPLRTLEFVTGEELEQGEDYFSIMRENLSQLTK